jgi:hypothetical protein
MQIISLQSAGLSPRKQMTDSGKDGEGKEPIYAIGGKIN